MTQQEFEDTLRQFIRRDPFVPFEVEMLDGRIIPINRPGLAIGGGAASHIMPDFDIVEFACEGVRRIQVSSV
jgi:hypothetical protein